MNVMILQTRMKNFTIHPSRKFLQQLMSFLPQLFAAGLQAKDIYPEIKKYFYKEHSNVTWGEFLTTKFGLWIDTHSSTDNTLMAAVE